MLIRRMRPRVLVDVVNHGDVRAGVGDREAVDRDKDRVGVRGAEVVEILDRDRPSRPRSPCLGVGGGQVGVERDAQNAADRNRSDGAREALYLRGDAPGLRVVEPDDGR